MDNYDTEHAPHAIAVRKHMKAMQDAFLKGDYEKAVVNGNTALVELRLAVTLIKHLAEQRKQRE
jgi:hypothetical protein